MSNKQIVSYWYTSALETKTVAQESYKDTHFDWAFFQWHLAIEKLLKGMIAKTGETPLPIHDLVKLARVSGIELDQTKRNHLNEITTYNIDARYDDYKRNFYKKVTEQSYHKKWHAICQEIFLWLQNMY